VDFWFPIARKKLEIHFPAPKAGLYGQKPIKRTQKHVILGVFVFVFEQRGYRFLGIPPNIIFYAKNIIVYYRYGLLRAS
jgi:hypothetical protein